MTPGYTTIDTRAVLAPVESETRTLAARRMDGGFDSSAMPNEIALESTPDAADVRFEQGGIRRNFGWTAQGSALSSRALGLAEYEYIHPTTGVKTRKPIVVRRSGGNAAIQRWTGSAWDAQSTSSRTMADKPVHVEVIQGAAVWADGNFLHMYRETGGYADIHDDFASGNTATTSGSSVEITLSSSATSGQYQIWGRFTIQSTGSMVWAVEPYISGAYVAGVWQLDDMTNEGTIPKIEHRRYDFNIVGTQPTKFRIRIVGIYSVTGQATPTVEVHGWNRTNDGDPGGGAQYIGFSASGTTFDVVSSEAPLGPTFAFGFEDRLVALGRTGDPQAISWSKGGNIEKWNNPNEGAGSISAVDTVVDPLDEIVAGAKVGEGLGAIFRKRSILRLFQTGILQLALGVADWEPGIGSESPLSVTSVPRGVAFLGHDLMPYLLTGSGLIPIGGPIIETLREAGITRPDVVVADYDPYLHQWLLAIPESGATACTRVYPFDFGHFAMTNQARWLPPFAAGITSMRVLTEF